MNLLALDDVQVSLPVRGEHRVVLRGLTLSLAEGESLAMVGESGSGKSMTARAIARLLPDGANVSGSIRFDDIDVLSLKGAALRRYRATEIAMIFQDPRVQMNPVRSIGDFLAEAPMANQGLKRSAAEALAVSLLADVGIPDGTRRLRQYPHELSGGLLQRVMIAAALSGKPRLLLADDPTTALDVSTQSEVMAIIDELRRQRAMSMLFITHDLELAAAVSDRTAVMYAGEIVEVSGSAMLTKSPRHPYSAGLLRARPDVSHAVHRLSAIPGRPLAAFEAPSGCAFSDRCAFRTEECELTHPALASHGSQAVRCIRADELTLGSAMEHTEVVDSVRTEMKRP